jgi:signal transduction histidine kinase
MGILQGFDYFILVWVFFSVIFLSGVIVICKRIFLSKKFTSKTNGNSEEINRALAATVALNNIILQTLDFDLLAQRVANAIPQFLGYETGVLAIVDESKGVLIRRTISETSGGNAALKSLEIPFANIEISLADKDNYCIKALKENKVYSTNSLYDVLRPAVSESNSEKVQKMMRTRTTLIYPIYSLDKKPMATFLVSLSKFENEISEYERRTISNFVDGVRIALVNSSLYTSLKNTTEQLKAANERLKEVDKLKDEFVSLASHELRTPMTVIKSYLWMMLDNKNVNSLSEKQKMYIDRAYTSTQRLINLVNDMLNVSRIESGRFTLAMQPVDLADLINTIYTEMLPKAQEQNIYLQFARPLQPLPKVQTDPERVEQILINLIGNSLKFTSENGIIRIIVDYDPTKKQEVVSVLDNGRGISQEDISKLFKKFSMVGNNYLVKQNTQGTGLGLYLSKAITELMGGKIWAESAGEGKGSKFSFTLKTV